MIRALLVLVAACGPTVTLHTKTSPRRVDVEKRASAGKLELFAHWSGDQVELVAKRVYELRVKRTVHYGTASLEFGRGSWIAELLEIPAGLMLIAAGPVAWESPSIFPSTPESKEEINTNWIIAMINPFQTAVAPHARAKPNSDVDVFADPPAIRAYRVALPVPALVVTYRALDDTERVIATGRIETDAFGRATVANLPGAIAIEVTVDNKLTVIPIDRDPASLGSTQ